MENNQTKLGVQKAIEYHAFLLNQAAVQKLHNCYSNDAVFMPEGHKSLSYQDIANLRTDGFLKNSGFEISYDFKEIDIDEKYAFVMATATTKTNDGNSRVLKESRDFFVLKLVDTDWKIYRHTFNNVAEI